MLTTCKICLCTQAKQFDHENGDYYCPYCHRIYEGGYEQDVPSLEALENAAISAYNQEYWDQNRRIRALISAVYQTSPFPWMHHMSEGENKILTPVQDEVATVARQEDFDMSMANARVLTSAPQLLEALGVLITAYRKLAKGLPEGEEDCGPLGYALQIYRRAYGLSRETMMSLRLNGDTVRFYRGVALLMEMNKPQLLAAMQRVQTEYLNAQDAQRHMEMYADALRLLKTYVVFWRNMWYQISVDRYQETQQNALVMRHLDGTPEMGFDITVSCPDHEAGANDVLISNHHSFEGLAEALVQAGVLEETCCVVKGYKLYLLKPIEREGIDVRQIH